MERVKNRFTLIEMLAVVAIASILIALITPAVQSLMFGNRVDQCVSNFKLGLEQAQSKAIASRKYVALILPYDHSATNDNLQYCKSGYRMAYVTRDGSNFNFDRWVENSDWKNPNAGALCVDINSANPPSGTPDTDWAGNMISRANSLGTNAAFDALSTLGNISNSTAPEVADLAANGSHCAVIFSPYGGVANNDLPIYFTFTEAKVDGDRYVYDNIDNFLVLKLNPITGQVTYFDPYYDPTLN